MDCGELEGMDWPRGERENLHEEIKFASCFSGKLASAKFTGISRSVGMGGREISDEHPDQRLVARSCWMLERL